MTVGEGEAFVWTPVPCWLGPADSASDRDNWCPIDRARFEEIPVHGKLDRLLIACGG